MVTSLTIFANLVRSELVIRFMSCLIHTFDAEEETILIYESTLNECSDTLLNC